MSMRARAEEYLALRRSLGRKMAGDGRMLLDFAGRLGPMPVSYDDPAVQTHDVCPGQDGCFPAYLTGIDD